MGNHNNLALASLTLNPLAPNPLVPNQSIKGGLYNDKKPSDSEIDYVATCIKAMAHPLRLKILFILTSGKKISVQNLVAKVGTSQSNISQHLLLLKQMGILICERQANKSFYKIENTQISTFIESIRTIFVESK